MICQSAHVKWRWNRKSAVGRAIPSSTPVRWTCALVALVLMLAIQPRVLQRAADGRKRKTSKSTSILGAPVKVCGGQKHLAQ